MGRVVSQDEYLRQITKTFKPLNEPLAHRNIPQNFEDLCSLLSEAFESKNVDLELVNHYLLTYKSNPDDWVSYKNFNPTGYTRNLVDAGNGNYNLIILCWNIEQASSIHDHADSNCFMKMLQGELVEVRFNKRCNDSECKSDNPKQLVKVAQKTIKTNDVCYINDNIGLHQVKNPSKTIGAISLHLYCPPFRFCRVYEKTGTSKICEMKFHTKFGQPINEI